MVRGRKPKTTAAKEASGALRKNPQRRNKQEPKAPKGSPKKPAVILVDQVASSQWDELCGLLSEMKILSTADRGVMIMYCTTYSEWLKYYKHVRGNGVSCPTANGAVTTSPEAHQYNKLSDRLLKMFAELGLTPSSRSRIKAPESSDDENPFVDILSRLSGTN